MKLQCQVNRARKYILKKKRESKQRHKDMSDRHYPVCDQYTGQYNPGLYGYWNKKFQDDTDMWNDVDENSCQIKYYNGRYNSDCNSTYQIKRDNERRDSTCNINDGCDDRCDNAYERAKWENNLDEISTISEQCKRRVLAETKEYRILDSTARNLPRSHHKSRVNRADNCQENSKIFGFESTSQYDYRQNRKLQVVPIELHHRRSTIDSAGQCLDEQVPPEFKSKGCDSETSALDVGSRSADALGESKINTMETILNRLSQDGLSEICEKRLNSMRLYTDPVLVTRPYPRSRISRQNSIGGNLQKLLTCRLRVLFCDEDETIGNVLLTYLRRTFLSVEVHDLSQGYYGRNLFDYWDSAMEDTQYFIVLLSTSFLEFAREDPGLRTAFQMMRFPGGNTLLLPIYLEDVAHTDSKWLLDFHNRLGIKLYSENLHKELKALHLWLKSTFEGNIQNMYSKFREMILQQFTT